MFPWCLVAFQKIFRKIFSSVWKRRRKTQMKGKTQATTQEKINDDTEHRPTTAPSIDRDLAFFARSRSMARSRSLRVRAVDRDLDPMRSREGEIAIDGEIAPSIAISIRFARSRSTASRGRGLEIAINDGAGSADWRLRTRTGDRGLEIAINDGEIAAWRSRSSARARFLSLSLSHFPETL